jgi:hypothetical protein
MKKFIVLLVLLISLMSCMSYVPPIFTTEEQKALTSMKNDFDNGYYSIVKSLYETTFTTYDGKKSPEYSRAKEIYENVLKIEAEKRKNTPPIERLKKKKDEVSGITWYQQSYFIHYTNSNLLSLYIGEKSDNVWMRLKASYYGENWIFFDSCLLSYEGNTFQVSFDQYRDKKTENDTKVWEWIDIKVNDKLLEYLGDYIYSTKPLIRLSGKYEKTRELTKDELLGLQDVYEAYIEIGKYD